MFGRKEKAGESEYPMDEKQNDKIKSRLDDGEEVVMSIRQSRIKIGGSPVTPNSIFITPKRIIIRNPTRMGLGEQIEDFPYDTITNVRLEKGMTSSSLVFTIPGLTELSKIERNTNFGGTYDFWGRDTPGTIDAIPRQKAEVAYRYIRQKIEEAKKKKQEVRVVGGTEQQSPLDLLKIRFVNGEITKEEYEEKKAVLEG